MPIVGNAYVSTADDRLGQQPGLTFCQKLGLPTPREPLPDRFCHQVTRGGPVTNETHALNNFYGTVKLLDGSQGIVVKEEITPDTHIIRIQQNGKTIGKATVKKMPLGSIISEGMGSNIEDAAIKAEDMMALVNIANQDARHQRLVPVVTDLQVTHPQYYTSLLATAALHAQSVVPGAKVYAELEPSKHVELTPAEISKNARKKNVHLYSDERSIGIEEKGPSTITNEASVISRRPDPNKLPSRRVVVIDNFSEPDYLIAHPKGNFDICHGDLVTATIKALYPNTEILQYDGTEEFDRPRELRILKDILARVEANQHIDAINMSYGDSITFDELNKVLSKYGHPTVTSNNLTEYRDTILSALKADPAWQEDIKLFSERNKILQALANQDVSIYIASGNNGPNYFKLDALLDPNPNIHIVGAMTDGKEALYSQKTGTTRSVQAHYPLSNTPDGISLLKDGITDISWMQETRIIDPKKIPRKILRGTSFACPTALAEDLLAKATRKSIRFVA